MVNTPVKTAVTDASGETVPADAELLKLLRTAAEATRHEIIEVRIFVDDGAYFAAVKTNVNWSDPCEFYRWDAETGELRLLCRWDGAEVTGIRTP